MGDELKKILSGELSQRSVNVDFQTNIGLSNKNRLLPLSDLNEIVDAGEQFDKERQNSSCFRIYGSIRTLFSNQLYNITGTDSLETLITNDKTIVEKNGWVGYENNSCDFIPLEPKPEKFKLDNWLIKLTYPYAYDDSIGFNNSPLSDGMSIIRKTDVVISNRDMTAFFTPVNHGLKVGDKIKVYNVGGLQSTEEYEIVRVGLESNEKTDNYVFILDVFDASIAVNPFSTYKRIVDGTESQYMFRKFKSISTGSTQYNLYNAAFSKNIFNDDVMLFNYKEDFDVSNLVDYLGRPITELYLSFIKEIDGIFWDTLDGGFITNEDDVKYNIRSIESIGNTPTNTSNKIHFNNIDILDDEYYGDVVEYNRIEVKDRVLSEIYHRFNSNDRKNNSRLEGYVYKAHHKITLRSFSSVVEEGDENTTNIPLYSEKFDGNRYLWRDLLTYGYIDEGGVGVDNPFVNGCHYIHQNYCLNVIRQNTCPNKYDLGNVDLACETYDETNFRVNISEDEC